jgi:hypothetical protein
LRYSVNYIKIARASHGAHAAHTLALRERLRCASVFIILGILAHFNEYETYEFELHDGKVAFGPDVDTTSCPEVCYDTETYCDKCSWHGAFNDLADNPE